MGKIVVKDQPCLDQVTCKSHDARQIYEDGSSYCFSCRTRFNAVDGEDFMVIPGKTKVKSKITLEEIAELPIRGFKDRGITKEVCDFFGVKVSYNADGEVAAHYYPYEEGKAYKVRNLPKTFEWINNSKDLFGRDKFSGGGKRIIITEGEIDALTIAQASLERYEKIYPVVAMSSAVMTKSLIENREWLRSFNEVVLCLDNDKAGKEAEAEAIKIIGLDKVRIASLPEKDPNAVYLKYNGTKLLQCVFDAAKYVPSGIITREALWERLVAYNNLPSLEYPRCINGVNAKVKGARLGEIALFVSGTSCGKSTLMREIMLCFQDTTPIEVKLGIVSLEEAPEETARKLVGMKLLRNPAEEEISIEDLKIGFDDLFADDRYIILDHQGSIADSSIMDKLEYMALSGAKYIFIDHVTMLVSEGAEGLTGNEAIDKVMNDLLKFVKRHNVWIGLVSHLRKTTNVGKAFEEGRMPNLDDIKGSGSIKQVSFDIIAFARNLMADDPIVRNTIDIAVLKSRYTGLTGSVSGAFYDYGTGRFKRADEAPHEEFTEV